ncbi:MAG: cob(I)yrinic acid a,c-diamide adenosyltransferase [Actinomycetota bacterium]|nr:cob(I)yrinic acid a,c-diamide adenosyltransferase [Actinomycetota bacterium]
MKIYTRKGDDGTTGLLYGDRVRKDSAQPAAYGAVDEAQAQIGLARATSAASAATGGELDELLIGIERDLWVLMAELATAASKRERLTPGQSLVTNDMVGGLEALIDSVMERFEAPTEFVVPGQTVVAAHLDVARTVVRRAERLALSASVGGSFVVSYLNRLSDLLWALARWQEGVSLTSRGASTAAS